MKDYNTALKELDKGNFCSLSYHTSHDRNLKGRGLVRILEIQAENGQYYSVINSEKGALDSTRVFFLNWNWKRVDKMLCDL